MRALLVVDRLERAEALGRRAQDGGRRVGGVLEQRQVQPLVAAVLLRLAGGDPLGEHPRLDHLHREPGEPARAHRGEGRAVVGAQPPRQPELAEGGVEDRPDVLGIGARHRLAARAG